MHERWEIIYFDGTTILLVENISAHSDLLRQRDTLLAKGLAGIEADRKAYRTASNSTLRRPPIPARLLGAAAVFQQRGHHREAAAIYELVTLGAPGMITAWLNLGINLNSIGNYADAQTALRKALPRLPRKSAPWTMAQMNLGISQIALERYNEGLRHLNQVVDIMPNNPLVWMWIHQAHLGAGRTADAQTALVRAKKISPEFAEVFLKARSQQKNK
jgi:tetratricopeptide (TPR) repeat protein